VREVRWAELEVTVLVSQRARRNGPPKLNAFGAIRMVLQTKLLLPRHLGYPFESGQSQCFASGLPT
jgi:hypothetical protein